MTRTPRATRAAGRTLWLAALLLSIPSAAAADTLFTIFGGISPFSATPERPTEASTSLTYGGTLAFKGRVGLEIDWGYSNRIAGGDHESGNARTLMFNVILDAGPRRGSLQPYVSGGAGLVSLKVIRYSDLFQATGPANNDPGINVGGGVYAAPGGPVSVRLDARFVRDLDATYGPDRQTAISFFRLTGGVTFGF